MAYKKLLLLVLFLVVSIFMPSNALANDVGSCEIRSACLSNQVAIAKTSADNNAHAALMSYEHFNNYLCCDQRIYDDDWGESKEQFSIADDAGQGHISAAGIFPQQVMGNFDSCTIENRACRPLDGEVCMAKISNAGTINGETQGHIYSCGDTTSGLQSICCCPSGTEWDEDAGLCNEFESFIEITSLAGSSSVFHGYNRVYEATITWQGVPEYAQYRFYEGPQGGAEPTGSWNIIEENNAVDYPVSRMITFSTAGDREVCVQARRNEPFLDTVTECIDVTVISADAQCTLENCQEIDPDYVTQQCISPFNSDTGDDINYTFEPSLLCSNPTLNCNCGKCADGYTWSETHQVCFSGDIEPLTIHQFEADPHTGQAPHTTRLLINITKNDLPPPQITYTIDYGNGTSVTRQGADRIVLQEEATYPFGEYYPRLTATNKTTQEAITFVNATNQAPVIQEFFVEPDEAHPRANPAITMNITSPHDEIDYTLETNDEENSNNIVSGTLTRNAQGLYTTTPEPPYGHFEQPLFTKEFVNRFTFSLSQKTSKHHVRNLLRLNNQ